MERVKSFWVGFAPQETRNEKRKTLNSLDERGVLGLAGRSMEILPGTFGAPGDQVAR